jgi:hypothetical protein
MRRPLILLVSVAAANIAFAINVPQDQAAFHSTNDGAQIGLERNNKKTKESLRSGYVIDPFKKSTRGYDEDGQIVNVGPGTGTRATADGQTRPPGPYKFIVRLKTGADLSSCKYGVGLCIVSLSCTCPSTLDGHLEQS